MAAAARLPAAVVAAPPGAPRPAPPRAPRLARRGRRGAAMVEALVAIPFFIVIFAASVFIGDFYGAKLQTMRAARHAAWTHASAACEGDLAETGYAGGSDLGQNGEGEGNPGEGSPGSQVLDKGYDEARITVTGEAEASGVLGGTKQEVKTKTSVLCNEKPEDGNLLGVFKYIGANLLPWDP